MINQLILEGRIVKKEKKNTKRGEPYFSLVIAYDTLKKENGAWSKKTSFIKGIYWKKINEKLENIIKPGFPVIVEGSLEQVSFKDEKNNIVYNYINIEKLHFNTVKNKSKKLKF